MVDTVDESQIEIFNTMRETVMNMVKAASDWVAIAFDAPSARAVVFGVHIGGHLFVEGLLLVVILFLLPRKVTSLLNGH